LAGIIGAGLIIGGALYLKNIGDRFQNQTDLMTRYLNGDVAAGNALRTNAARQAACVGTSHITGNLLSRHTRVATAQVHFRTNYGRLPGDGSNAYPVANTTANTLTTSGINTQIVQVAARNTNFLAYTPKVLNALCRVPTATAENFILAISKTNGDGVIVTVDNSGSQIDDIVKWVAKYGEQGANLVGKYGRHNVLLVSDTVRATVIAYKNNLPTGYNPPAVCVAISLRNPSIKGYGASSIYTNNPTIQNLTIEPSEGYMQYYRKNFIPSNVTPTVKNELIKLQKRIQDTKNAAEEFGLYYNYPPIPREGSFVPSRPVDNCAEIWAARDAILKGAMLDELSFYTINADNSYFEPCENCKRTFEGLLFIVD
jgi:hypothetical protein